VDAAKSIEDSVINIELKPLAQPPRFASEGCFCEDTRMWHP